MRTYVASLPLINMPQNEQVIRSKIRKNRLLCQTENDVVSLFRDVSDISDSGVSHVCLPVYLCI